jgi:hypothetical protein
MLNEQLRTADERWSYNLVIGWGGLINNSLSWKPAHYEMFHKSSNPIEVELPIVWKFHSKFQFRSKERQRKWLNDDFHNVYSPPMPINMIKLCRMRWMRHRSTSCMGEMRNAYGLYYTQILKGRDRVGRPGCRWKGGSRWWVLVNTVMNFRFHKRRQISRLGDCLLTSQLRLFPWCSLFFMRSSLSFSHWNGRVEYRLTWNWKFWSVQILKNTWTTSNWCDVAKSLETGVQLVSHGLNSLEMPFPIVQLGCLLSGTVQPTVVRCCSWLPQI